VAVLAAAEIGSPKRDIRRKAGVSLQRHTNPGDHRQAIVHMPRMRRPAATSDHISSCVDPVSPRAWKDREND
jgi:hypothetical protein